MPAVLVALYDDYATAAAVRTELVHDGFPTDRVQLTATREPGAAGVIPSRTARVRFRKYFRTLFDREDQRGYADFFAEHVCSGAVAVTVHPRGEREIARAQQILKRSTPRALGAQHLEDTALEQAASKHEQTLLQQVVAPGARENK
jgi:hypothetical protein